MDQCSVIIFFIDPWIYFLFHILFSLIHRSLMSPIFHSLSAEDIDLFVFHQASKMTLESLTKALRLGEEKVYLNLSQTGNLVSASLPIALKNALSEKRIQPGDLILMSGFGVGLSWGSLLMKF